MIYRSLPDRAEPEIAEPVHWRLEFAIPFALLDKWVGPFAPAEWRANLYKCGDETSHPHWASWAPMDKLNLHLPRSFGTLIFEEPPA